MRYITLEAVSDEYDTTPGFAIVGVPRTDGFMADRGRGISFIAHDLIEHQNGVKNIGPIWDEMEAMGGIWHTRGRWGDLQRGGYSIYTVEEHIASDFVRMGRDYTWGDDSLYPLLRRTRPHDYDDAFQEIIDHTRKGLRAELDDDEYRDFNMDLYCEQMLHRLRTGYRKAERRFGDRFESNSLFYKISEEVNRKVKWIDYEGQRFRLGYGGGQCTVEPIYEEEYA